MNENKQENNNISFGRLDGRLEEYQKGFWAWRVLARKAKKGEKFSSAGRAAKSTTKKQKKGGS